MCQNTGFYLRFARRRCCYARIDTKRFRCPRSIRRHSNVRYAFLRCQTVCVSKLSPMRARPLSGDIGCRWQKTARPALVKTYKAATLNWMLDNSRFCRHSYWTAPQSDIIEQHSHSNGNKGTSHAVLPEKGFVSKPSFQSLFDPGRDGFLAAGGS